MDQATPDSGGRRAATAPQRRPRLRGPGALTVGVDPGSQPAGQRRAVTGDAHLFQKPRGGHDPVGRCGGQPRHRLGRAFVAVPHRLVDIDEPFIPAENPRDHRHRVEQPDAPPVPHRGSRNGHAPATGAQGIAHAAGMGKGHAAQIEQGQRAPIVQFAPWVQIPWQAGVAADPGRQRVGARAATGQIQFQPHAKIRIHAVPLTMPPIASRGREGQATRTQRRHAEPALACAPCPDTSGRSAAGCDPKPRRIPPVLLDTPDPPPTGKGRRGLSLAGRVGVYDDPSQKEPECPSP